MDNTTPDPITLTLSNQEPTDSILELHWKPTDPWITLSSNTVTLSGDTSKTITITFHTDFLSPGTHTSSLDYTSNDPQSPQGTIPITLTKEEPKPSLHMTPSVIQHEYIEGTPTPCSFTLRNAQTNGSILHVKVESYDAWFYFPTDTFAIPSGESQECTIAFHAPLCSTKAPMTSHFTLFSNDPQHEKQTIPITLLVKPNALLIQLQIGNRIAYVQSPGESTKTPIRLDVPPTIINGRTVVPLRFLAETFGAQVEWFAKEEEIQMRYDDMLIHLWLHRHYGRTYDALIEKPNQPPEKIALETPPCLLQGRTMVPLRFIGETFGATLDWDASTQTITLIKDKKYG